jgi:hypothetical protein
MSDDKDPASSGWNQEERRKEPDRRSLGRQGKYDRRRNRCVQCAHFKEEDQTGKGVCLFHNTAMVSYAFACPQFAAADNPGEEAP